MVEVVIRGMKEEEAIKDKLLGKFEKDQINTFDQLSTTLSIQLKKYRGNAVQTSTVEQVNAITISGRFQTRRDDRRQNQYGSKYRNCSSVPYLNWPSNKEVPPHLARAGKFVSIQKDMSRRVLGMWKY